MIFRRIGKSITGFPFFMSFILLSINCQTVTAQFNEVGGGIGGTSYTGDLVRTYDITLNRPALNIFYRQNYNHLILQVLP